MASICKTLNVLVDPDCHLLADAVQRPMIEGRRELPIWLSDQVTRAINESQVVDCVGDVEPNTEPRTTLGKGSEKVVEDQRGLRQ